MVLVTRDEKVIEKFQELPSNSLTNVIHPELFHTVSDFRDKNAVKRYARGLYKSTLYNLGLIK